MLRDFVKRIIFSEFVIDDAMEPVLLNILSVG